MRKRYSLHRYRVGNGSKQFGVNLWGNSQRLGLEVSFWVWQISVMREF